MRKPPWLLGWRYNRCDDELVYTQGAGTAAVLTETNAMSPVETGIRGSYCWP